MQVVARLTPSLYDVHRKTVIVIIIHGRQSTVTYYGKTTRKPTTVLLFGSNSYNKYYGRYLFKRKTQ